jgi:hypothetical protein
MSQRWESCFQHTDTLLACSKEESRHTSLDMSFGTLISTDIVDALQKRPNLVCLKRNNFVADAKNNLVLLAHELKSIQP